MLTNIAFILPQSSHVLDIAGPVQLFQEAREMGEQISLHFLSTNDSSTSVSYSGLTLYADKVIPYYQEFFPNIIFVPGMELSKLSAIDPKFFSWLKKCAIKGAIICGVCTGAFILGNAGLLKGKRCTTHWKYIDQFRKEHKESTILNNRLFVQDGKIFTTAGVSAGIDLSLFILEKYFSSKLARDVAREAVVYFRRSENDPQVNALNGYRNHIGDTIHFIQDYIESNIAKHKELITISKLAELVYLSPRTLMRSFKKHTGITLGKYKTLVRREYAKNLYTSGKTENEIAEKLGVSTKQVSRILHN